MKHTIEKGIALANGIQLAYQIHGDKKKPVLLLVHGLGMPVTAWPDVLLAMLVAEGCCVVVFDNRDTGLSEKFDQLGVPSLTKALLKNLIGLNVNPPYQLTDMMADTAALMDELEIEQAHVVGVSMGGMISQLLAIHHPEKVMSLTSIMSTTGNRKLPGPSKVVQKQFMARPASDSYDDLLSHHSKTYQLIGSPAYPPSSEELAASFQQLVSGGAYPPGTARQLAAIIGAKNRVPLLKQLNIPSQVIHGAEDPLVPLAAGIDTAKAIPRSTFTAIEGMGHDLPAALLPELTRLIVSHVSYIESLEKQCA